MPILIKVASWHISAWSKQLISRALKDASSEYAYDFILGWVDYG
jgi:hypothetical protein